MRQALLIFNPRAGSHAAGATVPAIVEALRASGYDAEPRPTAAAGDATRIARAAADRDDAGIDAVFAFGGDGTLREVAAGLIGSDLPLGFLPAGTVNVMARALGVPLQPLAAARAAASWQARPFDVGRCGEQPFLMMASAGLDARVVARQSIVLKRSFGRFAVAARALDQWWLYDYPLIDVRLDGEDEPVRASLVVACNIPWYGGAFAMAPDADPADGLLDLVLLRGRGRLATLAFARDLALGSHLRRPDVVTVRTSALTLEAASPVPLQIDGDAVPVTPPLEITVQPAALRLLAAPAP